MALITKAVIPAAGHGTRFLPVTKAVPKEMLAVIDRPAVHYIVREAMESGVTEVIFVVNGAKESIGRYFGNDGGGACGDIELEEILDKVKFRYVTQEVADGTAGAVYLARNFTADEPFAVMYGDDVIINDNCAPCVAQLAEAYSRVGRTVLGVQDRPASEAVKYAVIKKGRQMGRLTEVLGLVEKPSAEDMPSTLSSLGRYILTPEIYLSIEKTPLFRGEKYLTDAIVGLLDNGVYAYEFEGRRFDLGDKFGFLQANIETGIKRFGGKMTAYLESLLK